MFHVVYASSATRLFSKPELEELLRKARQNNLKLNVTGMLLYKDGNFMQALEGDKQVVTKLVGAIERDTRHEGFLTLLQGTAEDPLFPYWSMGFRDLTDKSLANTPGYTPFMNTPLIDAEFSLNPNRCMKLLMLFRKKM